MLKESHHYCGSGSPCPHELINHSRFIPHLSACSTHFSVLTRQRGTLSIVLDNCPIAENYLFDQLWSSWIWLKLHWFDMLAKWVLNISENLDQFRWVFESCSVKLDKVNCVHLFESVAQILQFILINLELITSKETSFCLKLVQSCLLFCHCGVRVCWFDYTSHDKVPFNAFWWNSQFPSKNVDEVEYLANNRLALFVDYSDARVKMIRNNSTFLNWHA